MSNMGATRMAVKLITATTLLLGIGIAAAGPCDIPGEVRDIQEEYLHRAWNTDHGLPDNQVNAILQTRDGYVWAATPWGLARFDGVRLAVFNRGNTPDMENERCLALVEDQANTLWVLTEQGLLVRSTHGFRKFQVGPEIREFGLFADATNGIWTSSAQGDILYHCVVEGRYVAYPLPRGIIGIISSIHRQADGRTWIGNAESGLWLDPQFKRAQPAKGKPAQALPFLHSTLFDSSVGDYDLVTSRKESQGRLYRIDDGNWSLCLTNWFSNLSRPLFLASDRQGNLWLPLNQVGLLRWTPQRMTKFKVPLASTNDSVLCVQEDRDGNLWYGTVYGGLHCLQPRRLQMLSTLEGLAGSTAECLLEMPDGSLWIGTENGLLHYDQGRCTCFTATNGLARNIIRSLALDKSGTLWVGTLSGLNYLKDGKFLLHRFPGEWEEGKIRALLAARDGGLWVGTVRGLNRIYQGRQTKLTKAQGLSHDEVLSLLEDRSGDLWVGTAGGGLNRLSWSTQSPTKPAHTDPLGLPLSSLLSFPSFNEPSHADPSGQPTAITIISTTNGLANNYIRTLVQDAAGALWIGTDSGLHRYTQGRCSAVINQHHGLPENQINMLLADDASHLWIGGERSLCRVQLTMLNAVATGKTNSVAVVEHDHADGLPSLDISGKFSQPAGCRIRDGRLLFSTGEGVAIFDPKTLPDLTNPPPVVIERIRANGRIIHDNGPGGTDVTLRNPQPQLTLPPGSDRFLEIQYTANAFVGPEKTRFQYRLVGLEKDWTDAGTTRRAYYSNIRPGAYRFQVRAANKHGVWNEAGAAFSLVLQPFFYETWWFYLTCGSAASLLLFLGIVWHLKERRRVEQLERQVALEEQRRRIARDIHDELGASLTQIAQLSEDTLDQSAQAALNLPQIATLAEEAVGNIGEIVWANTPRYDTLEDLVSYLREYAAKYLSAASLDHQLSFPDTVPVYSVPGPFRRHLLAMVKETLHNIVKHAGAKQVELTLRLNENSLEVTVRDDGCGMDTAEKPRFGNGLVNIQERVSELKGSYAVDSKPQKGTTIRTRIPLPQKEKN